MENFNGAIFQGKQIELNYFVLDKIKKITALEDFNGPIFQTGHLTKWVRISGCDVCVCEKMCVQVSVYVCVMCTCVGGVRVPVCAHVRVCVCLRVCVCECVCVLSEAYEGSYVRFVCVV